MLSKLEPRPGNQRRPSSAAAVKKHHHLEENLITRLPETEYPKPQEHEFPLGDTAKIEKKKKVKRRAPESQAKRDVRPSARMDQHTAV